MSFMCVAASGRMGSKKGYYDKSNKSPYSLVLLGFVADT
jgi:hypothetical protein